MKVIKKALVTDDEVSIKTLIHDNKFNLDLINVLNEINKQLF